MARTFPPAESEGWTIHFIERKTRYWIEAQAGLKNALLFKNGVTSAWNWARSSESIRWFTDGERRYGKELWKLASVRLKSSEMPLTYQYRKVWREGLEVAIKVKGSQGKPHIEWLKQEHPFTPISPKSDVHANHNEAQNSSLRRRASGYRRRQNLYAKAVAGLNRALNMQRMIHNWVRPHWGLGKMETPAMAMGYINRPITLLELLSTRSFKCVTP